ncbi:MAG: class I SAM-dependent methyltransferase, partial [Nannocystaceae bacterium]
MSTPDRNAALRDRRVARVIDREIAPIWHDRFARLIIRNLPQKEGLFVLDIECGPGRLTTEVLQRTDRTTRVLALETSPALLELAKSRVRPEWKRRVYHKPGTFDDIMSMGDASYDLTLANLVLNETHDVGSAITELSRITRPGGRVMATMPMYGSWEEVEDIFAEVLLDAGLKDAARRLKRFRSVRPSPAQLSEVVRGQGIDRKDFVIEHERLQLLFPSGREFLFAPLIEHGPLRLWKAIIGKEGSAAELFWKLKEAIDTYYQGHVFAVTLVAGLINIGLPDPETDQPALTAEFWQHYPQLDALWGRMANPRGIQSPFSGSDDDDFDFDLDIDFEDPG